MDLPGAEKGGALAPEGPGAERGQPSSCAATPSASVQLSALALVVRALTDQKAAAAPFAASKLTRCADCELVLRLGKEA